MDAHVPDAAAATVGRRRVSVAILLSAVAVAAAGAVIGFAVGRTGGDSLARVGSAVVNVTSDLAGGGTAVGSGMIIASGGTVVTNYHVINGAQRISVSVAHLGTRSAAVTGIDPRDDVALLQLEGASQLPIVAIGDSSRVAVGDRVTAIGSPAGGGDTPVTTQGAVTSLSQTVTAAGPDGANPETLSGLIEVAVAVRSSDCGGPLVNGAGEVVGMDTAGADRIRQSRPDVNSGFAIPINSVIAIAHDIESGAPNPNVLRGQSVILGVNVTDSVSPPGAAVTAVEPDSPAQAAGIAAMDVIVELGGERIDSVATLQSAISAHHAGDRVVVVWVDATARQHSATVQLASGIAS